MGINWVAIQATCSVIGIGIAAYIPWKLRRDELKAAAERRRSEARSLAVAIQPQILYLQTRAADVSRAMTGERREVRFQASSLDDCHVQMPEALKNTVERLHLLGRAAAPPCAKIRRSGAAV